LRLSLSSAGAATPGADAGTDVLGVGGFVPFSSSDWPGRLCAVVFVQGCPWRCRYCHNPELQARSQGPDAAQPLAWQAVFEVLQRRVGLLDGVVFSGGEPTLDPGLPAAIDQVRALGYGVGLHSAGIAADRFAAVLPRVDWVGLDVKTGYADYPRVTGVARSGRSPRHCLELLLASGVAHELRTTDHPALQDDAALLALARELKALGARHWVLQAWQERADALDQGLSACWRWPHDSVLQALRQDLPALLLRP
jgi:pyruvate formate lyase activating enzyme